MNWYRVLIAHEGRKKDYEFATEGDLRMLALEQMGFVLNLGPHEDPVPAQETPGTYDLEPEPTPEVKKRGRRGKQASAGQGSGEEVQPQAGVGTRDEGDSPD